MSLPGTVLYAQKLSRVEQKASAGLACTRRYKAGARWNQKEEVFPGGSELKDFGLSKGTPATFSPPMACYC